MFFIHFSGHGMFQKDPKGLQEDGNCETIVPVDFRKKGMISSTRLSEILIHPLPEGCSLTAVFDCCHSGTALNLPYTFIEDIEEDEKKYKAMVVQTMH